MTIALNLADPLRGAEFSLDRRYRYRLWDKWERERYVCFLMLNPSTADETKLDPTLRRCRGFAKSWGFGGFVVVNLFAVVSADPKILLTHEDAVGDVERMTTIGRTVNNSAVIIEECKNADIVVAGWGAFPEARKRAKDVMEMLDSWGRIHCFGVTKEGHPKHPLYLCRDLRPTPFAKVDRRNA